MAVIPVSRPSIAIGVRLGLTGLRLLWSANVWFAPQHLTAPRVVSAQLKVLPVAIAATSFVRPATSTGTLLLVVVPSPSCPKSLGPQHLTPPLFVSAHVPQLAEMAATPLARPETSTGILVLSVVVPSPSWPYSLSPQHLTPPLLVRAQVCRYPGAIAVNVGFGSGDDDVGDGLNVGGANVGGGVAAGDDVGGWVMPAGCGYGGGVAAVVGLAADEQAATRMPTAIFVATGSSEERIPCPQGGGWVVTSGGARCHLGVLAPVRLIRQPPRRLVYELHAFEIGRTHVTL
jgi:hypothetical protein